jgi:uncharacterized protein DUF4440
VFSEYMGPNGRRRAMLTPCSPRLCCFVLLAFILLTSAFPQMQQQEDGPLDPSLPEGVTVRAIITRFAAQEETYKQAREHYTYRQVVRMQTLDDRNSPDGEYNTTFDVTVNDQGERVTKQVSQPRDTLKRIRVTPEDIDDMRNRLPFVLTTDEIPDYNIRYRGQQETNGTHTYVFDISPKAMEEGRRYFEGRIWVDSNQYQIVKSAGKAVPDIYNENGENLFPSFTTYRELVDGKYWFPSYTKSDDYLHFSTDSIHVVETVDYINYKRFGAESRIIFDGKQVGSDEPQQARDQRGNSSQQQSGQTPYPGPSNRQQNNVPTPSQSTPAQQNSRAPQKPVNPPPQHAQYVQEALMSLEREICEVITKREVSILNRILTDDYQLISANGDSESKFDFLSDVQKGRAGTFGQPENMQVQVNGDRAIVTGERQESIPIDRSRMQTARVRFTDNFVRRAGEWFLTQTKEAAVVRR